MDHNKHESSREASEGAWWRWSHGKTGTVASSSRTYNSVGGSNSPASLEGEATSQTDALKWTRRSTRTGLTPREEPSLWKSSATASSSFPLSASATTPSRRPLGGMAGRRKANSSIKTDTTARRKLVSTINSDTKMAADQQKQSYTDITWTSGSTKRKIARKDKKPSRSTSVMSTTPKRSNNKSFDERVSCSDRSLPISMTLGASKISIRESPYKQELDSAMLTTTACESSISTIQTNTLQSASSMNIGSINDPLMDCARAVLQDCIRQRCIENNVLRKRSIDSMSKGEVSGAIKLGESSPLSCGSSSSDDELSQLSSLEATWNSTAKATADQEYKLQIEELLRQQMFHHSDHSSSPDLDYLNPLLEEKGLPVEIRYQLPIALGTANETDKECPICQLRYGIGDHIVSLPCEHFFHACCVDKWLWSHTSCPLCRTEVSLDAFEEPRGTKHQFTECSEMDREDIRRKMKTQSAGFRPVIPASEADHLHARLSSMTVHDEENIEQSQFKYLVCPKPQRPYSS